MNNSIAIREYVDHLGIDHIEALPAAGVPVPIAYATHPRLAPHWEIFLGASISAVDHPPAFVKTPMAAREWVRILAELAGAGSPGAALVVEENDVEAI